MSIQTNLLTCVVCMTAGIVCVLGYTAVAWLFLFCSPKVSGNKGEIQLLISSRLAISHYLDVVSQRPSAAKKQTIRTEQDGTVGEYIWRPLSQYQKSCKLLTTLT